jgi:ABC-type Fe3+/spermidine/putrescine transport system ATPase subunit
MNAIVLTGRLDAAPSTTSKSVLSIRDLRICFGAMTAIDGVSLTVNRGELVSLLGPSGCGKSTLLKAVAGLVRPASGQIALDSAELRTGFMF